MYILAYIVGITIMIAAGIVGTQFLIFAHDHSHIDYFHDGILFGALGVIALGMILVVLVKFYEDFEKDRRNRSKSEND